MKRERVSMRQILSEHVPESALETCISLWYECPFHFRVARRRASKLGDYRFDQRTREHAISVNGNLNKYAFLITYVHEVAHLRVTEYYGRNVQPHGAEWKRTFTGLMRPLLTDDVFPEQLLEILRRHLRNPRASSQTDPGLAEALRQYDAEANGVCLNEVEEGLVFLYHGRRYRKLARRRTRVLCRDTENGRHYLIPAIALVACCGDASRREQ